MSHPLGGWIREAAFRISASEIPRKRLDEIGWTDFQSDPPPATDQLHEFAALAVELCCLDDEGNWVRLPALLVALVRATESVMSKHVSVEELLALSAHVENGIGDLDHIKFWFQVHFGPQLGA